MIGVLPLAIEGWERVGKCESRAVWLADRHYSRQTPGASGFMPPGRTLTMVRGEVAVWGVVENLDPVGNRRWRCSIFRNEGGERSSDLISEATALSFSWWESHYGGRPPVPLTTEVDPGKTRRKRDPGRCFLRAGWEHVAWRRGLRVLAAPGEMSRTTLVVLS